MKYPEFFLRNTGRAAAIPYRTPLTLMSIIASRSSTLPASSGIIAIRLAMSTITSIHPNAARPESISARTLLAFRNIGFLHDRLAAFATNLGGDCLETVEPARAERDPPFQIGQVACGAFAEAAGGPSDDDLAFNMFEVYLHRLSPARASSRVVGDLSCNHPSESDIADHPGPKFDVV